MGNACCEGTYVNDLSYIDSLGSFIKFLLENLTRVQAEIVNSSPSHKSSKSNYKEEVLRNITAKNYARYQYYIFLNNVLVKLKILCEDYFFITKGYQIMEKENDKEKKETIGFGSADLSEQDFDLEKAKMYLGKVLDTEDNMEMKNLENLKNQMLKSIYS